MKLKENPQEGIQEICCKICIQGNFKELCTVCDIHFYLRNSEMKPERTGRSRNEERFKNARFEDFR